MGVNSKTIEDLQLCRRVYGPNGVADTRNSFSTGTMPSVFVRNSTRSEMFLQKFCENNGAPFDTGEYIKAVNSETP